MVVQPGGAASVPKTPSYLLRELGPQVQAAPSRGEAGLWVLTGPAELVWDLGWVPTSRGLKAT